MGSGCRIAVWAKLQPAELAVEISTEEHSRMLTTLPAVVTTPPNGDSLAVVEAGVGTDGGVEVDRCGLGKGQRGARSLSPGGVHR